MSVDTAKPKQIKNIPYQYNSKLFECQTLNSFKFGYANLALSSCLNLSKLFARSKMYKID